MVESAKSLAKVVTHNICCAPSIRLVFPLYVDQAQFSLHKFMLISASHLLILYILQNGFQDYLLLHFPRD